MAEGERRKARMALRLVLSADDPALVELRQTSYSWVSICCIAAISAF